MKVRYTACSPVGGRQGDVADVTAKEGRALVRMGLAVDVSRETSARPASTRTTRVDPIESLKRVQADLDARDKESE